MLSRGDMIKTYPLQQREGGVGGQLLEKLRLIYGKYWPDYIKWYSITLS